MFPSVKRAKIFSGGIVHAKNISRVDGATSHDLCVTAVLQDIYYYVIQWARGINKRWSIASFRYILLLCVHITEWSIRIYYTRRTFEFDRFSSSYIPRIFWSRPPWKGLISAESLYYIRVCTVPCVCDKSTNPVIQHIITSYIPLKYINNTYNTPYTRQLITVYMFKCRHV